MSRKETTKGLIKATNSYLLKKGFSIYNEIGVVAWGRRRADVLALNLKGDIVLAETKSCVADYTSDRKWHSYLPCCNKMWFCFTEPTFAVLRDSAMPVFREHGVGVLLLSPQTGYLYSALSARYRPMDGKTKKSVVLRMAWRNGEVNKRTNRRTRVFLDQSSSLQNRGAYK